MCLCDGSAVNIASPHSLEPRASLSWARPQQLSSIQARLLIGNPEIKPTTLQVGSSQCGSSSIPVLQYPSMRRCSNLLESRPSACPNFAQMDRLIILRNFWPCRCSSQHFSWQQISNAGKRHRTPLSKFGPEDRRPAQSKRLSPPSCRNRAQPPPTRPPPCCPQLGRGGGSSLIRGVDCGFASAS